MNDEERQLDGLLRRMDRFKRSPDVPKETLGGEMLAFFKQVQKLQKKFGRIADVWGALVPQLLEEHCALQSFSRGTLTVLVDSSAHLYDLKQLLLAGLEKQFTAACKAQGLRKIALKSGRWYEEREGEKRVRFDL
ncbi:MAG: DciA family protein [Tepidisphaeraceae bacterium]|jgi:hypothetical protein